MSTTGRYDLGYWHRDHPQTEELGETHGSIIKGLGLLPDDLTTVFTRVQHSGYLRRISAVFDAKRSIQLKARAELR
jgi:hypothetical protein